MAYSSYVSLDHSRVQASDLSEPIPTSSQSENPAVKTWHHDCSNMSGFQYREMPLYFSRDLITSDDWLNAEGALESDTKGIYLMNITEPSPIGGPFYYGPAVTYDLPDAFPVSGLRNFSVQIELVNSNPDDSGIAAIALLDDNLAPVLLASCEDNKILWSSGFLSWKYYPRNFSILFDFLGKKSYDYVLSNYESSLGFINATWSASFIHGEGIRGVIPAYGNLNGSIVAESDVEYSRAIKYLALAIGNRYEDGYRTAPPFLIHDIYLEYEFGGDIDTSPPSLTPQRNRECVVGETGNVITWECADDHPYRCWVFDKRPAQAVWDHLLEGVLWNGSPITLSLDGLDLGEYAFELFLQDRAGFIVWDFVQVSVIENPFIKSFISFISANWLAILILSIVGIACILDLRDRRKVARLRGAAWSRSFQK